MWTIQVVTAKGTSPPGLMVSQSLLDPVIERLFAHPDVLMVIATAVPTIGLTVAQKCKWCGEYH